METVDLALKIHPKTKRLHVVAYAPAVAGFQERVQATLAPFSKRVTVTYGDEPTLPEMLATLKTLPADSLIFYVRYSPCDQGARLSIPRDAAGHRPGRAGADLLQPETCTWARGSSAA